MVTPRTPPLPLHAEQKQHLNPHLHHHPPPHPFPIFAFYKPDFMPATDTTDDCRWPPRASISSGLRKAQCHVIACAQYTLQPLQHQRQTTGPSYTTDNDTPIDRRAALCNFPSPFSLIEDTLPYSHLVQSMWGPQQRAARHRHQSLHHWSSVYQLSCYCADHSCCRPLYRICGLSR